MTRSRMFRGHLYDEYQKQKNVWLADLEEQHGDDRKFTGPLAIDIQFKLPPPFNASLETKKKLAGTPITTAPSLAELIKLFGQLADGILFTNDVIVVCLRAEKRFSNDPVTEFTIREFSSGTKKTKGIASNCSRDNLPIGPEW